MRVLVRRPMDPTEIAKVLKVYTPTLLDHHSSVLQRFRSARERSDSVCDVEQLTLDHYARYFLESDIGQSGTSDIKIVMAPSEQDVVLHRGGCHCGAVR